MHLQLDTSVSNRIKRHETTFDYDKIKITIKNVQIFKHEYDIKRHLNTKQN